MARHPGPREARPEYKLRAGHIGRVVLSPLHIGLHILGWQQNDLVANRHQLSSPIMRCTTGFNADLCRFQLREKPQNLCAPQLFLKDRLLLRIHAMQLKFTLGRVHTNSDNIAHGRLLSFEIQTTSLWHV